MGERKLIERVGSTHDALCVDHIHQLLALLLIVGMTYFSRLSLFLYFERMEPIIASPTEFAEGSAFPLLHSIDQNVREILCLMQDRVGVRASSGFSSQCPTPPSQSSIPFPVSPVQCNAPAPRPTGKPGMAQCKVGQLGSFIANGQLLTGLVVSSNYAWINVRVGNDYHTIRPKDFAASELQAAPVVQQHQPRPTLPAHVPTHLDAVSARPPLRSSQCVVTAVNEDSWISVQELTQRRATCSFGLRQAQLVRRRATTVSFSVHEW